MTLTIVRGLPPGLPDRPFFLKPPRPLGFAIFNLHSSDLKMDQPPDPEWPGMYLFGCRMVSSPT
jgi:hypothetical protein